MHQILVWEWGKKVVKLVAKWVSTTKTTRQDLKVAQGIKKGHDKV
jgi:hypothetical protein